MKKILIIEDDIAIAEVERDFLEIYGYSVVLETNGIDGLEQALSGAYNLIILDIMLPGLDGYEICKKIRSKLDIPLIMITARREDIDKIRGLGLGADDYITKPFSPTEMVARVKANLAQYDRLVNVKAREEKTDEIVIGALRVNPKNRRVYVNDNEIELKNKEYELLLLLISNPDIIFSKEQLYESIWGLDVYGDIKTVAVHINRLREKIEQNPQNPVYIQTVWGVGYRFKV